MRTLLFIALPLSLAACGGPAADRLAEKAARKAGENAVAAMAGATSDSQVQVQDGQVRIEHDAGRMQLDTSASGLPRPAWWPQDVFLPEEAVIQQLAENEGARVLAAMVPRQGAALNEAIARAMQAEGWTARRSSLAADGAGMAAFSKDGREVTVLLLPARRGEAGVMATYRLRGTRAQ